MSTGSEAFEYRRRSQKAAGLKVTAASKRRNPYSGGSDSQKNLQGITRGAMKEMARRKGEYQRDKKVWDKEKAKVRSKERNQQKKARRNAAQRSDVFLRAEKW